MTALHSRPQVLKASYFEAGIQTVYCHVTTAHGSVDHPTLTGRRAPHSARYCLLATEFESTSRQLKLNLPTNWEVEHVAELFLNPLLKITNARLVADAVLLSSASEISIVPRSSAHRQLADTLSFTGTEQALVVRLTDGRGAGPDASLDQLRGRILGLGSYAEANNVITQIDRCSFHQKKIIPASGNNIVQGAVEVYVPSNLQGCELTVGEGAGCQDDITNAIQAKLRVSSLDSFGLIYICLADGAIYNGSFDWFAFAWDSKPRETCSQLTVLMHETGHRFGFQHSGVANDEMGDKTDLMGISSEEIGKPCYCYNGAKYHQSGWMGDTEEIYTPSGTEGKTFRLLALTQKHLASDGDRTLVQVGNLFIVYNRAVDFNDGVESLQNAVTVTRQDPDTRLSVLIGGLATNPNLYYYRQNFNPYTNSGVFLGHIGVEVCERTTEQSTGALYATVSVWDTDLGQQSTCNPEIAQNLNSASSLGTSANCANSKNAVVLDGVSRVCNWIGQRTQFCYVDDDTGAMVAITCKEQCGLC